MEDIRKGKGFGYLSSSGKICQIKCFECGRENYAMAVFSGCCAFCGFDANRGESNDIKRNNTDSPRKDSKRSKRISN